VQVAWDNTQHQRQQLASKSTSIADHPFPLSMD
jgi:hypothetical protein